MERKFILGGVEIPYEKGFEGHSDADVLSHAIGDALLGAASLGDIGKMFPDTDSQYKGISSLVLLKKINETVKKSGYKIVNIDTTVILQDPKINKYTEEIRNRLKDTLKINLNQISVKATTNEGIGFIGRQEGAAVFAIALLRKL